MFSSRLVLGLTALLLLLSLSECRKGGGGFRGGGSSRSSSRSSSSYSRSSSSRSYSGRSRSSSSESYSSSSRSRSYGSSIGGAKTNSYKSPGYGTKFGTSFKRGVGKYGGKGFSKKAVGLGVGAGFVGGAALGAAGTVATMGVYHRYNKYRELMKGLDSISDYYDDYYYGNNCFGGCPFNAHCEWGFCECNRGYERRFGSCVRDWDSAHPRANNFDPFKSCSEESMCQKIDMNLICDKNMTTSGEGRCECRQDMKWNKEAGECQLYIDVDCSSITYDTKPSPVILEAVNKTLEKIDNTKEVELDTKADNGTLSASPNVTLSNSLLSTIDPSKASQAEIKEAFCRDVDSLSWEFNTSDNSGSNSGLSGWEIFGIIFGVLVVLVFCCCRICLNVFK